MKIGLDWCILTFAVNFIFSLVAVFSYRLFRSVRHTLTYRIAPDKKRVLIVGAGEGGSMILREIISSDKIALEPVGFVVSTLKLIFFINYVQTKNSSPRNSRRPSAVSLSNCTFG